MSASRSRELTVAIAGNPNSGKTTIFNYLTGSDQQVGNWAGVTVEKKEGMFHGEEISGRLIDLPGIYSLSADSEDEVVARRFLAEASYDLVINVVDAADLERNLYLTMQLREMEIPTLIVVNKLDLAARNGISLDISELRRGLKAPVIGIRAVDQKDLQFMTGEIERLLVSGEELGSQFMIAYANPIEEFISELPLPKRAGSPVEKMGRRAAALALLEEDRVVTQMALKEGLDPKKLASLVDSVKTALDDDLDTTIAQARYRAVEALKQSVKHEQRENTSRVRIDNIVMHRFWGVPIFFGVMFLVFTVTMTIGGAFIDFFDILFGAVFVDGLGYLLEFVGSPPWLVMILAEGFGGGIQTISTFIPVIFFMFLMLGLLEDSGYMSRAAFVMDKFMRFVGLPGKAFVPMLVGFGCTVPAIMATRTLDSRRDRFLTIFMTPFMSCGARLPVYALFAAAFFGQGAGLVVFSIYMAGILLSVLTGLVMKQTLFKGSFSPFIMELPEYNVPQMGKVLKYAWDRLNIFMYRAGKIILIVVVILTVLGSFGLDGSFGNDAGENSLLAVIGKTITPVFTPMGIEEENWPATVGLFTGIFAKEAVVGTLQALYIVSDEGDDDAAFSLPGAVKEAFVTLGGNFAGLAAGIFDPFGLGMVSGDADIVAEEVETDTAIFSAIRRNFTPAAGYVYMLFVLIYFPCVAALGAAFREAGKFYGTVLALYLTVLAWIVSVLVYQAAEGHSLPWILAALGGAGAVYISLMLLGWRERKLEASTYL